MKNINFKKKLSLVILGIIAAAIILEAGLSLLSYLTVNFSKCNKVPYSSNSGHIQVLCLGDSFTYGVGAGFDKSYPAQLEGILRQAIGKEINVINGGISSANSAIVLARLKLFLKRITPDAVIVMAGHNDSWNFKKVQNNFGWRVSLRKFFSNSRLSQLISIIVHDLKYKAARNQYLEYKSNQKSDRKSRDSINKFIEEANLLRDRGLYEQAIEKYRQALKLNPYHHLTLLEMARNYKLKKDYKKSLDIMEFSLSIAPEDIQSWEEVKDLFNRQKDFDKAINFYSRMLSFYPGNKIAEKQLVQWYMQLGDKYYQERDYNKVISCYQRAMAISPDAAGVYNRIYFNKTIEHDEPLWYKRKRTELVKNCKKIIQKDIIDKITADNLIKIARTCKEKGILLIFSGYPEKMYNGILLAAKEYEIPLVDQRPGFTSVEVKNRQEEYFTKDRHCTVKGYALVAKNIANELLNRLNKRSSF